MSTGRPRILVIGVGSIGERHVRCFLATGRCEVAFCEPQPELRQRVASQYPVAGSYANLDAALPDDFHAAVICTPAHLHASLGLKAVLAGLHVLIEKPLAIGWDGVDDLAEAVAMRAVVAGVAYVYRSHPVLEAMKAALDSGRFGRPLQLVATSGQHFPTYRPAYREIYYRSRTTGGGAVQDALTHIVNAGEWLTGPVIEVVADAAHRALPGVDVEDTVNVIARHGAVLASYSLNQHQAPNESTITVVCERGTVRFEVHENRWRWMTEPGQAWHDEPGEPLERDCLFTRQANLFLDALQTHTSPPCSFADGLQTMRVNLAILKSIESRAWQVVV
ncbi:MAG: Gfo/Idh/MocA family oxidoreductase [Planctomycetales bacterium]|nr:Gfo/Idh/MocA family oxidoreductase [Planctomycetales bacterium]MCA9203208.1 Gfo/Idh/MocA family oxidoreductase [Planctomycetales bacterium]